jgi:hypothetical protein
MSLLLESEFNRALHMFVEKEEKSAIEDFVSSQIDKTRKYLAKNLPNDISKDPG